VNAIAPAADDVFLEVGPGRGALTLPLLAAARHVVAFEIDRDLAGGLEAAGHSNLTVVRGDFLAATHTLIRQILDSARLGEGPVRLVGNLPYNVTSPILFKCVELFESGLALRDVVVMLQREVADRITAAPGTPEYGVLSVLLRHVADVDRLLLLPPGAFRPPPAVRSALLKLRPHPPSPAPDDLATFRALTRAVFTRRRKTLANALGAYGSDGRIRPAELLERAGLDGRRRPETLDLAEFVRLANAAAGQPVR
jgi:16S rRNA (adenine1518-N6/adenine1519-N6)-dimethyltransferase